MADVKNSEARDNVVLSEQEKKVIFILRDIKYGEVKIVVQDGVIVRVDEIRKSIKI
ncbi:MAG: YezD family protein [Clostridiales bacterium]|nr:YezD family protein [Clostridiales bacterium]